MITLGASQGFELDLMIVLACAAVITLVLSRFRVATIPGYLIAGVLIGPGALGLVSDPGSIEAVGHYALIVLMFAIGMHLDVSSLKHGAVSIVSTGVITTLSATGLIWAILAPSPLGSKGALAVGMGFALSSTAVVLRLMSQKRKLHTANGRASLGVLLIQDLIVIVYLSVLPLLAIVPGEGEGAAEQEGMGTITSAALAIVVITTLILIGRRAIPKLLQEAARFGGQEVMLVLTAAIALSAALITSSLGLSAELGAFIAGFLLASTPFRHELSGQLNPIRDIFMALFFTAIGLQVDIEVLLPIWWIIPTGVLALIVLKALNIAIVARLCGAETALSFRMGMTLAQSGEFSIVVFAVAHELGLISAEHTSILISIVIASLIVTPTVMGMGTRTGELAQRVLGKPIGKLPVLLREDESHVPVPVKRVIVAGYGIIGRTCVERLESKGVQCVVIELNQGTVRRLKREGRSAVFGDISNPEVLESAGIEHARVIVLAMPDSDSTMRAIRAIRALDPKIHIVVRVSMQPRAAIAEALGADLVVVEETVAADVLANKVMECAQDPTAQLVPDDPAPEQPAE